MKLTKEQSPPLRRWTARSFKARLSQSRKLNPSTTGRDSLDLRTMTSAGTVASVGTGPTNVDPRAWEVVEAEDALLLGTATVKIDVMEAEDSLTMIEEKIEVIEADLAATTATTVTTSEETTGTALDLQDAIMTEESPVIVTREADLSAETSETTEEEIETQIEMEIDKRGDAAEVPVDLTLEAPKTEREVAEKAAATEERLEKTMVVPHSSNKVFVSTAIRKVTRRSLALSMVAPEKEVWTEGEIIESIVLEEAVAEAETAEATLLDNSPGADLPAPHTKAEKTERTATEKPPIKTEKDSPARNRASTTVNKRKEDTEVPYLGPDPPKEDATLRTATIENECD